MKGVSPLIAAVLLVAFTLAVAGIVSVFVTQFSEERISETEERGSSAVDCTFARISFASSDVEHNLTGSSVNITAQNAGSVDLYDLQIILDVDGVQHLYSPTENTKKTSADTWQAGQTIILEANITDSPSGSIDSVAVRSSVCPQNARKTVVL